MHKLLVIVFVFLIGTVNAQELNCTVKVNYDQIGGTNFQIFKTLEKGLADFVNKTNWTTQKVKNNERNKHRTINTFIVFNFLSRPIGFVYKIS